MERRHHSMLFPQPLDTMSVSLRVFGPLGAAVALWGRPWPQRGSCRGDGCPSERWCCQGQPAPPGQTAVVWFCRRGAESAGFWTGVTDLKEAEGWATWPVQPQHSLQAVVSRVPPPASPPPSLPSSDSPLHPQAFLWFGVLEQWAPARPGQASQCGASGTLLRAP